MATASLVVSVLALLASTAVAIRQVRLARSASRLNLGVDLLGRYLDGDLAESERTVGTELADADRSLALADLPQPVDRHAQQHPQTSGYRFFEDLAARSVQVDATSAARRFDVKSFARPAPTPHDQRDQPPNTAG